MNELTLNEAAHVAALGDVAADLLRKIAQATGLTLDAVATAVCEEAQRRAFTEAMDRLN